MKKHLFILILCFLPVFLAGCRTAQSPQQAKSASDNTKTTHDAAPTTEAENTGTTHDAAPKAEADNTGTTHDAAPKAEADKKPVSKLYTITPSSETFKSTAEDGTLLLYSDYQELHMDGETYPTLTENFNAWQKQKHTDREQIHAFYTETAQEVLLSSEEFYGYTMSQEFSVKRLDSRVLSLTEYAYEYLGAAHPSYSIQGYNFDTATGELLTLPAISKDYEDFSAAAISYIQDFLEKNNTSGVSYFDDYKKTIKESFGSTPWYFSAAGITFIYNTYTLAPYAAGSFEVTLPMDIFQNHIKEEYQLTTEPGIAFVPFGEQAAATINTPKDTLSLTITDGYYIDGPEVYEDIAPVITLNDKTFTTEEYFYRITDCYLIQQPNRTLLLLDGDMASNDYTTLLFDITDGTLQVVSSIFASIKMPHVDTVTLSVRIDALGTYFSSTSYDLSDGKEFQPLVDSYEISSAYSTLKTTRDLPVTNSKGKNLYLPAGSVLSAASTDGESYMDVSIAEDSEIYRIHFTRKDSVIYIDEVPEYEYFEMLPYAG